MKQKQEKVIECCGKPLKFELQAGVHPSSSYKKEYTTCSECGLIYERNRSKSHAYRQNLETGGCNCTACGSEIEAARVAHPIHDGLFPMSGSGKCRYEMVPFCPKCEKEPSFHGAPVGD